MDQRTLLSHFASRADITPRMEKFPRLFFFVVQAEPVMPVLENCVVSSPRFNITALGSSVYYSLEHFPVPRSRFSHFHSVAVKRSLEPGPVSQHSPFARAVGSPSPAPFSLIAG